MNAGAAFYVAGKADTLEDAVKLAAEIIDSGKAKARLDEFIKLSNQNKKLQRQRTHDRIGQIELDRSTKDSESTYYKIGGNCLGWN